MDSLPHKIRGIREDLAIGLVTISILLAQIIYLSCGFIAVSQDEYSRVLLGASWAKAPYIFGGSWAWLPGHFYLLGLALKIHYDLSFTPRIVTMIFSLAALGMLYLLTRNLFNRWVALLCVLIVGLNPIYISLSLTPMADIVYLALIIAFLHFFILWADNKTDRYLLLAALMIGGATSLRYEAWFIMAIFNVYLGLRCIIELWTRRLAHPVWLLAIGLSCLPAVSWMIGNYIYMGDPFFFISWRLSNSIGRVGPITNLIPVLSYAELLLKKGGIICVLAIAGITLSNRFLGRKIWLYLLLSLAPLIVLTLHGGAIGTAYTQRFCIPYLTLLTPFCAYAIWWAVAAEKPSFRYSWQQVGLVLMSLCNLWIVFLAFSATESGVFICLLALVNIAFSYVLLDRKHWIFLTLSLSPLPILLVIRKIGFFPEVKELYFGLYLFFLILFYAFNIRKVGGIFDPPSDRQWQKVALGMIAIICLYNLLGVFNEKPWRQGARVEGLQVGMRVRKLFENDTLAEDDKVLLEYIRSHSTIIRVVSNHPGNFILDRITFSIMAPFDREADTNSFLLDKDSSPYKIDNPAEPKPEYLPCPAYQRNFQKDRPTPCYEPQTNPFSRNPPVDLDVYLADEYIRLVIMKDPKIEVLIIQQTGFKKIDQVGDYHFYLAQ